MLQRTLDSDERAIFALIIFIDEGPRSRRYGRTAALRLIGQPCDEDDGDDYYFFVLFLVMEHQWNDIDREHRSSRGENLSQCHFVHHESHMD
jgi:hypothetical protein